MSDPSIIDVTFLNNNPSFVLSPSPTSSFPISIVDSIRGEKGEKGDTGSPAPTPTNSTNVLTKCLFGLYKTYTASANGHTTLSMFEIEAEALAFRIIIPNISPNPVPGVRVAISVGTGFPDRAAHWVTPSTPPGSTGWLQLQAGGLDSVTLAPSFDTNIASWTEFDLAALRTLPESSGGLPIIAVRVQYPAGSVVTCPMNGNYGWRVDDGHHRLLRASEQDVLGVDNISAYTTTSSLDDNVAIPVIQYITVKQGRQVLISGDSTMEGIGAGVRCYGAVQRAANSASTQVSPVEYCNSGLYAQTPSTYSKGLGYYSALVKPTTAFYSPYSINNTPAGGMAPWSVAEDYFGIARVMDDLLKLPRPPRLVLVPGLPTNPVYRDTGSGDQARRDMNTFFGTIGGASVLTGYDTTFAGTRLSNGQDQIKVGYTDDNCHPNDVGYDHLASVVSSFIV